MGFVYLIYDNGNDLYKIGVTRNASSKRLKSLQTGNPNGLEVLVMYETKYPFRLETMLHAYYKNKRIRNEWFELSCDDAVGFKDCCDKMMVNINALSENPFFTKDLV